VPSTLDEKVSKTALTVIKLEAKLIFKLGFWSGLFGGGAAESYDRCFWGCDVALPLFGFGCLDQTGSSCKAGLIAVLCERGVWIERDGITRAVRKLNTCYREF
jgi:hypothetical protein